VPFVAYDHFLALAERSRWDERDVDLREDARLWPTLGSAALRTAIAGFCVAETAVAEELTPIARLADADVAACLRAQQADERRHARFFARVARELVGCAPAALAAEADPRWRELFTVTLPAVARGDSLAEAVGLYHMVLEGLVLTRGLQALRDGPLPGLAHGAELVLRDERWHVGLGVRLLHDLGVPQAAILAQAERVGGDLEPLRRRLAIARR